MKYSKIGVCKNVSNICFGTANLFQKKKVTVKQSQILINNCIKKGVNFFDTADQYGEGLVEEILGQVIKKEKKKIFISTKIGQLNGFSSQVIQKSIDNSLKRLKVDSIDFLFFHSGSNKEFSNEKMWTILNKNKETGKIKNLGLSFKTSYLVNGDFFQLDNAFNYNVNIINVAYNPFFSFAEKIFKNKKYFMYHFISRLTFSSGLVFKAKKNQKFIQYFGEKNLEKILTFKSKYKHNDVIGKNIIKKVLKKNKIKSCIIGASKPYHLRVI
jgi:myo-inositol catabolism protein IolS